MAEGQFDYTRHGQIDSYIHQWCEHRNENVVFEKDGEKNNNATRVHTSDSNRPGLNVM